MSSFRIDKEDIIGVWESKEIQPYNYKDSIEITLYLGDNTSSIRITKSDTDENYFLEGFELIEKNGILNDYDIIFKNSELNKGKNLVLNCKVYSFNPLVFIVDFLKYDKRYIEKL